MFVAKLLVLHVFFYEKYVKETPERLWAIAGNHTQVCPLSKAIPSKIQGVKLE